METDVDSQQASGSGSDKSNGMSDDEFWNGAQPMAEPSHVSGDDGTQRLSKAGQPGEDALRSARSGSETVEVPNDADRREGWDAAQAGTEKVVDLQYSHVLHEDLVVQNVAKA